MRLQETKEALINNVLNKLASADLSAYKDKNKPQRQAKYEIKLITYTCEIAEALGVEYLKVNALNLGYVVEALVNALMSDLELYYIASNDTINGEEIKSLVINQSHELTPQQISRPLYIYMYNGKAKAFELYYLNELQAIEFYYSLNGKTRKQFTKTEVLEFSNKTLVKSWGVGR